MPNRLAGATSPYLRQHAENPVDWWPWSDEAFAVARERDVPLLLSVGYAACHWCHVMAHESFEDDATAAVINDRFVAIKVDREERPDIDAVYMAATQALTGGGGWPMTVFLDHDGHAFYAGTYFPPVPRPGMPSFTDVLAAVAHAWASDRERVGRAAAHLHSALSRPALQPGQGELPTAADVADAVDRLAGEFDTAHGGFGGAPKFPPSPTLEFLLRAHALHTGSASPTGPGAPEPPTPDRVGDAALTMAARTMAAMARGGMYDQLGGGFARYSVDARWVVPHFEKMLSDNAQLLRLYAHWWRATADPLARRVAVETAAFLLAELRTDEGAFASSLDADSEGREGAFYVWTPAQLEAVLGEDDAAWVARLCSVTDEGTFEHGSSVLQLRAEPEDPARWARCRERLARARAQRPAPARDDKVVTAWNGLAIAALAEAGALLDDPGLVTAATVCAEHLATRHWSPATRQLVRTSLAGEVNADAPGVLEDYADLAEGLLSLYQVTGQERWFHWAGDLLDVVLDRFADPEGGFFDTADDVAPLVRRPQDPTDGVAPSGWSAAAGALVTYAALTGDARSRGAAEAAVARLMEVARRSPRFTGWTWATATALLAGPVQVAVILPGGSKLAEDGRPAELAEDERPAEPAEAGAREPLHVAALHSTQPGAVVALAVEGAGDVPLLRDRPARNGLPTAYPCRGFVCDLPVTDVEQLRQALAR